MRLIILAAGYGQRLSPASDATPKALLDLGGGKCILDLQLEAAAAAGVEDVWVVTGFKAEDIEKRLSERSELGVETNTLYNPFFRTTNNLVSLWCARSVLDQDFILLNGDTLFTQPVLPDLLATTGQFTAVVARKNHYDPDDNRVTLNGDLIKWIGRDIEDADTDADWGGMCAVRGEGRTEFLNRLDVLIRQPEMRAEYGYMYLFRDLLSRDYAMNILEIRPEDWAEVDFQMDLEFVRNHIARFIG